LQVVVLLEVFEVRFEDHRLTIPGDSLEYAAFLTGQVIEQRSSPLDDA
jgi:hypothetical protein